MISAVFLLKLTIVLLPGAALFLLSRKMTAAWRYRLAVVTFGTTVCLPITLKIPHVGDSSVLTIVVNTSTRLTAGHAQSLQVITAIWVTGTVFILLRFCLGYAYLRWQTRKACTVSGAPPVPIRTAAVTTPLLCGWLHPVILMPVGFEHWSHKRQQLAIEHELAHYHRRDHWTALLVLAAQALYWFHPLIWWLSAKLKAEREFACDDRVLQSGVSADEYAHLLVEIARQHSSPVLSGYAMLSRNNHLKGRIMHILQFRKSGPSKRNRLLFTAAASALMLTGLLVPASAGQEKVYRIGGDVTAPKLIYKVEPEYSEKPKQDKVQGSVLLRLVITADGKSEDIQVVRGLDPDLDENAVQAISQWQFQPATKDGKAVPVEANIVVDFRLK